MLEHVKRGVCAVAHTLAFRLPVRKQGASRVLGGRAVFGPNIESVAVKLGSAAYPRFADLREPRRVLMPVAPINLAQHRWIAASVFSTDCPNRDTRGYRRGVCWGPSDCLIHE